MARESVSQLMEEGTRLHQVGRIAEAERVYRQVLASQPNHAEALHLAGLAAHQMGRGEQARELIGRAIAAKPKMGLFHSDLAALLRGEKKLEQARASAGRAIELSPNHAMAHNNLGNVLKDMGKLDEAMESYRRAIQLKPELAEAHCNLGSALQAAGRHAEALPCLRRAVELRPNFVSAHYCLGIAWQHLNGLDEAMEAYRKVIELAPEHAEARNNLGVVLWNKGRLDEAVECYRWVAQRKPNYVEVYVNLADAFKELGKFDQAIEYCRKAIKLDPKRTEPHNNLGNVFLAQGKLDEAIAAFRRSIQLKPQNVAAYNNLAAAQKDGGKLGDALATLRQALELDPTSSVVHSNLVYGLHFSADDSVAVIAAEHRRWAKAHATKLAQEIQPHDNNRDPDRRLRLGYLSPDFREHSAQFFIEPILASHDAGQFEVFCYSNVAKPDAVTRRMRQYPVQWREIHGRNDEDVAKLIRADQIDILVDLALHMARNRMLLLARKPAPVQVAHIGYPASTGLPTMDYRITDPYLDPPSLPIWGPEEPVRLPHTFWCYDPIVEEPAVAALPALSAGQITFGSLNNPCKVSPAAIGLWSRVLHAVPNSKMIVLMPEDTGTRSFFMGQFALHKIPAQRVQFVSRRPRKDYLAIYHRIDIGLDPLPYTGHTTSCDSFWMGVPVVTLPGKTSVSRGGASLASNLSLPELIAKSPADFVKIAAALAGDVPRLKNLRGELRGRMKASPLMDRVGYTRDLEKAYRSMWKQWAQTPQG